MSFRGCLLIFLSLGISVGQSRKSDAPPDAQNAAASLNQFSRAVQDLTSRVSPSVVRIMTTRYGTQQDSGRNDVVVGRQQTIGSGVIIDPDGYILTNAHVVDSAQTIKVDLVSTGEEDIRGVLARARSAPQDASLVGEFKEGDIALIKVARSGLPALHFADYRKLQQGEVVFAFGSPQGLQNSVSMGIVSSIARQPDPDSPFLYIQTDTPINPGNSGGPLINAAGEIVGLNTFIITQSGGNEGVGFAIPSTILRLAAGNLRKYGHVHRSSVGMGLQAITPTLAKALKLPRDSGVIVSDVLPGGPAEQAGMKLNDILLSIDGRPTDTIPSMLGFFFQHGGGEHIRFEVLRGEERVALDVVSVEQQHKADHLADFVDPVKDFIPALGILGTTLSPQLQALMGEVRLPTGVVVAARIQNGTALNSTLQAGDVIHALNGDFVYTVEALKTALANLKAGDPVALLIERSGQLQYLAFELSY
jgi:serine protease Do